MAFNHRDLWDASYVRRQLSTRSLSESKAFLYFLTITAFDWLQFTAMQLGRPAELTNPETAGAWLALGITLTGVIFLFVCNGGSQGRDFLYRYFPLSVVVGWKFVAVMTVVLAVVQLDGWSKVAAMVVINALMFARIGHHLRTLASTT